MPELQPIPVPPPGHLLAWVLANQAGVARLVEQHNAMVGARLALISKVAGQGTSLLAHGSGYSELRLPLQFSQRVSAPTGGATVDTECRAALTLLLQQLTTTGINA